MIQNYPAGMGLILRLPIGVKADGKKFSSSESIGLHPEMK